MIIKSTRIQAGGAPNAARHVLDREDSNESIAILAGSRETILAGDAIARAWAQKYGLRHFTISPDAPLDASQLREVVRLILAEYRVPAANPMTMIEHVKGRADGSQVPHYHLLIGEVNPETGRVLDSRHTMRRDEKLSRVCEVRFGHRLIKGGHNRAVVAALRREGRTDIADAMAALTEGDRPRSAFREQQHQRAKRLHENLSEARQAVRTAMALADGPAALVAALARSGLRVLPGLKSGVWIVASRETGAVLGSLDRLAQMRRADVRTFMKGRGNGANHPNNSGRSTRGPAQHRVPDAAAGSTGGQRRTIPHHDDPGNAVATDRGGSGDRREDNRVVCRNRLDAALINRVLGGQRGRLDSLKRQATAAAAAGGGTNNDHGAAASPGRFAMIEGDDAGAALRFLREWGAQMEAENRRRFGA